MAGDGAGAHPPSVSIFSFPSSTLPTLLQSSVTSSLEFPEAEHEAERATAGFLDWPCTWPGTGFPSLELENGAHPGRALSWGGIGLLGGS